MHDALEAAEVERVRAAAEVARAEAERAAAEKAKAEAEAAKAAAEAARAEAEAKRAAAEAATERYRLEIRAASEVAQAEAQASTGFGTCNSYRASPVRGSMVTPATSPVRHSLANALSNDDFPISP